ncbi:SDR family NAD(P)-dependent oxidoreductase [Streptomyces sp. T12]|uniref:SDR family NAD(P)-dependent oxidoreductase n=1 Tax=Streptomyces sp. T12 TaxID=477697 RepID=UPI0023668412|nr:SDR family NAD(P)-dependent oxidoreductase [Streptomyces sp. T12]WDF35310.1 SDR family NAD(P)-dependent oxidoreductase [Streptomyces sp. T12]WDF44478.1 SDR family NAD(P)-dependent oxidoreductase [Streptomyces sp. T12]
MGEDWEILSALAVQADVARSKDKLTELAERLEGRHAVNIQVIAADLAVPGAGGHLAADITHRGLAIDVLINNAGSAMHGRFVDADQSRAAEQIALNAGAVGDLTGRFLPAMVKRGRGAVINVASTAGFQPDPYMAVQGATKAFVLSYSEALWAKNTGDRCGRPGPVPRCDRDTVPRCRGYRLGVSRQAPDTTASRQHGTARIAPASASALGRQRPRERTLGQTSRTASPVGDSPHQ